MSARPRPPWQSRFSSAVQSGTDLQFEAGAFVGYLQPEAVGADFAFDVYSLRFVQLVAVTDRVGERFFEGHLDAEVVAATGIPAESFELSKDFLQERDVRTPSTGQLLPRGPAPARFGHALCTPQRHSNFRVRTKQS